MKEFQRVQTFVEANKKFPEFEEDFSIIQKDEKLYEAYKDIKFLHNSCYERNVAFIEKKKKSTVNAFGKLFDFLEKALEYQKKNLAWFTFARWFNKNSAQIFDHLAKIQSANQEENKNEEPPIPGKTSTESTKNICYLFQDF